MQIWVQTVGHADGDGNLARVALREAREETGIEGLKILTPGIDCAVLLIPERPDEPEHLHFDVRYLIHAPKDSCIQKNHESVEMRWMECDELIQLTSDDSTLRLAKVAFEIANEQFGVGNVS